MISDVEADFSTLAKQCPMGGVLQHANAIGHKGNVVIKLINLPNSPLPPSTWGYVDPGEGDQTSSTASTSPPSTTATQKEPATPTPKGPIKPHKHPGRMAMPLE